MCTAHSKLPSSSAGLRSVNPARAPTPVRHITFRGVSSPCPTRAHPARHPVRIRLRLLERAFLQFPLAPPSSSSRAPPLISTSTLQTTPMAISPSITSHPIRGWLLSLLESPGAPTGRAPLPAFAPPSTSSSSSCPAPLRSSRSSRKLLPPPQSPLGSDEAQCHVPSSPSCSRPARAPLLVALRMRSLASTRDVPLLVPLRPVPCPPPAPSRALAPTRISLPLLHGPLH
ncbi:hypothetical protein DFH09DRAFT_1371432 [Mycena vulgaris]|nr:hypothetical protein DFH09DRAFT_1371432 [Mycena vulgaris]